MSYEDRNERNKVYRKALVTFGAFSQLTKAIEELSEAQKEICRFLQGELDLEHLAEEVADATIMLEQVRQMLPIDTEVNGYITAKIERLVDRIKKWQAEKTDQPPFSPEDVDRVFAESLERKKGNA